MNHKPTILNVSHNYFIAGGSDSYFFGHSSLLREQGHKVIPFCAASISNEYSDYQEFFPASQSRSGNILGQAARHIYSPVAKNKMAALLSQERVDLAHFHIYYGKLTASIIAPIRERNIPIVQTLHEYKLICPVYSLVSNGKICEACRGGAFWKALPRRCNRGQIDRTLLSVIESYTSRYLGAEKYIDHFIAVSDFQRSKIIDNGFPESKVTTVHNFIDTNRFSPGEWAGEYVLYFGRLERLKGVFDLLAASKELPQISFKIAGAGSEESELRDIIRSEKMTNVELVGFKSGNELHELISGAFCTVLPSLWYEPFGLTILESFALSRPVVANRIGGISELISSESDGLLCEPGNKANLVDSIRFMHRNPAIAKAMGKAGRNKVENQFTKARHYQSVKKLYSQLLG